MLLPYLPWILVHSNSLPYLSKFSNSTYRIHPKCWVTLSSYHTCPKIWNSPFYYLLMYLKYCCRYGKQCRPWSDVAVCGIWSGSTLFAEAYLPQYLGLLLYIVFYYLLLCVKIAGCVINSKPWSDAVFYDIWSWSTLFAQACLSQYSITYMLYAGLYNKSNLIYLPCILGEKGWNSSYFPMYFIHFFWRS